MAKDKYINKTLVVVLLLVIHGIYSQANNPNNDTIHVSTEKYEGIIWGKDYPVNIRDDKSLRWNPSKEDIEQAELLLQTFVTKQGKKKKGLVNQVGNCPIIYLNIDKYLRQYIGKINSKGEKTLEINCFWKENVEQFPNWKTHLITVLDGCSFYWSIKVNLSKKKCFDYWINGE